MLHSAMGLAIRSCQNTGFTKRDDSLAAMRDAIAMGNPHISEVYSPPRVTSLAHQPGLRAGFALDLSVLDEDDGLPGEFDDIDKKRKPCVLSKKQCHISWYEVQCAKLSASYNL